MKKIYINPAIEVIGVQLHPLMDTSNVGFGDPTDNAGGAEGREINDIFYDDDDL